MRRRAAAGPAALAAASLAAAVMALTLAAPARATPAAPRRATRAESGRATRAESGRAAPAESGRAARAESGRAAPAPPELDATAACLFDADTDQVLYEANGEAELPIASTTKLMTALVTLQHVHDLSTLFTQNEYYPSPVDSQIGLVPGERMSVHDLLLALLLPSADDAAEDLAYNVGGGSIERFVAMMNADAQALGLTRTHYSTPIGLDAPGNYSSACDLDRLAGDDLASSAYFRRVVALPAATLWSGRYVRHVVNRNDLVARVPWIRGVKTGHTAAAGYVLVALGEQDGMDLLGSVLGTPSEAARDQAALALLGYGFDAFRAVSPVSLGQPLARPRERGRRGRALAVATAAFTRIVPRGEAVRVIVDVPSVLRGPLARHAIVGEATVELAGQPAARIPLELAAPVPAPRRRRLPARLTARPSTLMLLAPVLVAAGGLAVGRRRVARAVRSGRLDAG